MCEESMIDLTTNMNMSCWNKCRIRGPLDVFIWIANKCKWFEVWFGRNHTMHSLYQCMIWNLTSIACPFEKKGIRKRHVVLWRWCVLWTKVCVIVRFKSKVVINYNYIKTCTLKWTRFIFNSDFETI